MLYDTLDTIPYKLFFRIQETGNLTLLGKADPEKLLEIWESLEEQHSFKTQTSESIKVFRLSKTIDELLITHAMVVTACGCLRFEYNSDLIEILKKNGYQLTDENYHENIDIIERESNAYLQRAENYKRMLPVQEEQQVEQEYTIDDLMASYCAILGIYIGDFNKVTYSAFKGFERQVNQKIDSLKNTTNGK